MHNSAHSLQCSCFLQSQGYTFDTKYQDQDLTQETEKKRAKEKTQGLFNASLTPPPHPTPPQCSLIYTHHLEIELCCPCASGHSENLYTGCSTTTLTNALCPPQTGYLLNVAVERQSSGGLAACYLCILQNVVNKHHTPPGVQKFLDIRFKIYW